MQISELFVSDVTRDIPPVVYFHEQTPKKLADEVSEYIITGGWPPEHPNHKRVPNGIHEQYVHLLNGITAELNKTGGPDLPNAWISGFYGSGKSSFAKLLGLALDGVALPDGKSLADAWLRRDTSPKAKDLRDAWHNLRQRIDPIAVVFDVGSIARDNEHVHAVAVRQVQSRLGYCSTDSLVADFELDLERSGLYQQFLDVAAQTLGQPWPEIKDRPLAEEDFSLVMHKLDEAKYTDPMSWFMSRGGTSGPGKSPDDAVKAIHDMLQFRNPKATLFLVVDEVSQYVHSNKDRLDRLRAFATALGSGLKGKAWLLALGQQKLDEESDNTMLVWVKDRFPLNLRVHLAATNIRDVVHKRLLHKNTEGEKELRTLFDKRRPDLKLYAYGCSDVSAEEFIEVYPMLPGHIDLLLQITSALRTRSSRVQGDDQAIRGLLQLLGELFRDQKLADMPVGSLVSLDRIYEIQHTALDSDTQASMSRIMNQSADDESGLMIRAAKAVALLELIQETEPTTADLVSRCLYDRIDLGNQVDAVTEALEELRRRNLLGYSEKQGYKIQSTAGEEWERDRREIGVSRDTISGHVQDAFKHLLALAEKPKLEGRPFPLGAVFSDGRRYEDESIVDPRDDASVWIDFRFLPKEDRSEADWLRRSNETSFENRLVWVCGDVENVNQQVRELARSKGMVEKFRPRRDSLSPAKRLLWQTEEIRLEELTSKVRDAVATAWQTGRFYFRGDKYEAREQGAAFATSVSKMAGAILTKLFPHFVATTVAPSELQQLLEPELSGPSTKFLDDELGILELDTGRYVPACTGLVPRRVQERIENEGGLSGTALLKHFGGPPYGYRPEVVKACVVGLLRGTKLRIQLADGGEITAIRDAGVQDLFDKDRDFRRADYFPAGDDDIGPQTRARICKFFAEHLHCPLDREDHLIADAVGTHFPSQSKRLRDVLSRLARLPDRHDPPGAFVKLDKALEQCTAKVRQTKPTVQQVKKHLDVLRDGIQLLNIYDAELTDEAARAVNDAVMIRDYQLHQLLDLDELDAEIASTGDRIGSHLKAERPWREIAALDMDLDAVREAYQEQRRQLLGLQEEETEAARGRVRMRPGFSTLSADQSHSVLRPLTDAVTDTTEEAIAPALAELKDPFLLRLERAEEQANDLLDEILSAGDQPLIRKVSLNLHNREIASKEEVEALVEEIRALLLEHWSPDVRIRII